jgi:hypothetical protein
MPLVHAVSSNHGLSVKAYAGDGSVLLAFDLTESLTPGFAGFAIKRRSPAGAEEPVLNRISFDKQYTRHTEAADREWFDTHDDPVQYFRWLDFPPDAAEGKYAYTVTAMYFDDDFETTGKLHEGKSTTVAIELNTRDYPKFEIGFTRGYLSSQAYADKFHNAAIRPDETSVDFDTAQYKKQYEWLGYHARRMLLQFTSVNRTRA